MLSYILGITWAFGYFNTLGRASQFIFVVLNSSVGIVVLAQNVLLNKKMREASIKAWRSRFFLFFFFSSRLKLRHLKSLPGLLLPDPPRHQFVLPRNPKSARLSATEQTSTTTARNLSAPKENECIVRKKYSHRIKKLFSPYIYSIVFC